MWNLDTDKDIKAEKANSGLKYCLIASLKRWAASRNSSGILLEWMMEENIVYLTMLKKNNEKTAHKVKSLITGKSGSLINLGLSAIPALD